MKALSLSVLMLMCLSCSEKLVRVQPYEREYLAQKKMLAEPVEPAAEQEGHVFLIKEASAGGDTSFQGGCGCR